MEKFIFQLNEQPSQQIMAEELAHHFYQNNPYWVEVGEPLELENFTRKEAINILRNELGGGYTINGDIITANNPGQYLKAISQHLQDVATTFNNSDYPLGWWKNEVCQYGGILIALDDDMLTLNEFMLYVISKKQEGTSTFCIGSIFEYV